MVTGIAGCLGDNADEVAQLTERTIAPDEVAAQRVTAEAFWQCLTSADLPAVLSEEESGLILVLWDQNEVVTVAYQSGDGYGGITRGVTWRHDVEGKAENFDSVFDSPLGEYHLLIDGIDHSAVYEECYKSSGFQDPMKETDPAEERRDKEQITVASLEWAKCARENGYPQVGDVEPIVADNYETRPTVVLPRSITQDQLVTLIEACPIYGNGRAGETKAAAVGFDVSGFDGRGTSSSLSEEEYAHFWSLTRVLYGEFSSAIEGAAEPE